MVEEFFGTRDLSGPVVESKVVPKICQSAGDVSQAALSEENLEEGSEGLDDEEFPGDDLELSDLDDDSEGDCIEEEDVLEDDVAVSSRRSALSKRKTL